MAFCKHCGFKLEDGANFCPMCGTPIGSETKQDSEIPQKKFSKKGGLIATIIVLAVIALGGAAWYFLGNQQDKYSLEGLAKAAVNYDEIGSFHEGLAMVRKEEKYGFIDKMGNEVIPCIYDGLEGGAFYEGIAFVCQGDKQFAIDKKNNKVFDYSYDGLRVFSNGLAAVCKNNKWGYINKNGEEIIKCSFDEAYSFSEGRAFVSQGEKYGYIDMEGKVVIPLMYEWFGSIEDTEFHEGLAVVSKNGKRGYIDLKGNEIIPCVYQSANHFSEGLASVNKEDKWGCIDKKGNIVINFSDGFIEPFSEGIAWKEKDDGYVAINSKNEVLFTCNHDMAFPFHDGFALVEDREDRYTGYSYLIDKKGKEYFTQIKQEIYDFSEGLAVVVRNGVYGYIDKRGNSTFDLKDEEIKKLVDAKLREKEEARKEEERLAAEEQQREIDNSDSYSSNDYSTDNSSNNHVEVSNILGECELQIRSIQSEIENLCNTYVQLYGSADDFKRENLRMTMISGVGDWQSKANRVFEICIMKLNKAGETNAANRMREEKTQFYSASERIKHQALEMTGSEY